MNRSVVQALILKDWRLQRLLVMLSLAAGGIALAVLQVRCEMAFFLGSTWFFVSMIVLGCMLPIANVINERKKQNLAFLMSLPVSVLQYAMAKMVSTIGMFLVSWAAFVVAGATFILSRPDIPNGIIPVMLILAALTLIGFCVVAGAALVSESEGCSIAATIVCNSLYGVASYFIIFNPAIHGDLKSPVPVWSPIVLTILAWEIAAIALILGITFYLQSRKRDFI